MPSMIDFKTGRPVRFYRPPESGGGSGGGDGWEEGLDITSATHVQSFSVASEGEPWGITFKPDGTRMYICGRQAEEVWEYHLSTAWDISTAALAHTFDMSGIQSDQNGIAFKSDGTMLYVTSMQSGRVYAWSLSTAWDISTVEDASRVFYRSSSDDDGPYGLTFKPDGTRMYIAGNETDSIFAYDLSAAWDIETASLAHSKDVSDQETLPEGVEFSPDGATMLIAGPNSKSVHEYALSTPWDVSTASHTQSLNISGDVWFARDIAFKADGTKMYVPDTNDDTVNEYDVPTS